MVTDLWLMQDGLAEGHSIVVDMEGSSLSHLAKVNILAMKKFMYYIQVSPAIHYISCFVLLSFTSEMYESTQQIWINYYRKHCRYV